MDFEVLAKHHNKADFDCGNDDINRYLQTIASQHAKKNISITHILADGETIKAFYTLSNSQITDHQLKGYPKVIPAILIGRIGIDKRYQGQGLFKVIFAHAFLGIKKFARFSGMAFIIIDPKTDTLNQYYQNMGFMPFDGNRLIFPIEKLQ